MIRVGSLTQRVVAAVPQNFHPGQRLDAVGKSEREPVRDDDLSGLDPKRPCPALKSPHTTTNMATRARR